jgi:hypothetical protein
MVIMPEPQSPAMTGPMPNVNIADDIARADIVVAGTVARISPENGPVSLVSPQANPGDDRLYKAEFSVIRQITGRPAQSPVVVFFLRGRSPSRQWLELSLNETVLLFLVRVRGGYVPLTTIDPPIRTLPNLDVPPAGVSGAMAVARELEQIILTADPDSGLAMLVRASAVRASMRRPVNPGLLRDAAREQPARRLALVGIALSAGQFEMLAELGRLASSAVWPPDPGLERVILESLSKVHDPEARPQLALLMLSHVPGLALAAAMALRQLGIRAAQPDFVHALDHPDQDVRYQALMGLAELEPGVGQAPSLPLYLQDEAYYLRLWKRWSQQSPSNIDANDPT